MLAQDVMRQSRVCHICLEDPPPSYEELFPVDTAKMNDSLNCVVDNKELSDEPKDDVPKLELQKDPSRTYFTKRKVWPEGEGCYHGELDWKGRRAGHGRMVWGDGSRVYMGYWAKNRMEGEGAIWWEGTGTYYIGGWRKGLVHGIGRLVYGPRSDTPGDVYEGEFR